MATAGASLTDALQWAVTLLGQLPQLVAAGVDITAIASSARDKLQTMANEGRGPTAQEWDELNQSIDAHLQQLNQPRTPS